MVPLTMALGAFARVFAALWTLPLLSRRELPQLWRIGFAALLAALFAMQQGNAAQGSAPNLVVTLLSETAVGLYMGLSGALVFYAIELVGGLLDYQAGLGLAVSIAPDEAAPGAPFRLFFVAVGTLTFLSTGGLQEMVAALLGSFATVGVGQGTLSSGAVAALVQDGTKLFLLGLTMALPFSVVLLLCDIGFGIIGRVVPQINLLSDNIPVKTMLAALLLAITLPAFGRLLAPWMQAVTQAIQHL